MAFALTERQKIAHLYRRFGFGALPEDVDAGLKIGAEGVFKGLLNFQNVDEQFPISPWEICFEEGKDELYFDAYRIAAWWGLRMVMSRRPLQEKLGLFWHDHFAVSATKVEFGPMMLDYLEVLRKFGSGDFATLLIEVSKTPAMLFWLDTMHSQRGAPNENFARELFELFTLGIGNYTELDVKEAARAFTGWGIRFLIYERGGENVQEVGKECVSKSRPMTAFAFSPSLHDSDSKSILGKSSAWTGEQVLSMLADRPETSLHLAKKLWEFFAYPNPEPKVVERIAAAYKRSNRQISSLIQAIYDSPEFWSEACYRQSIKSPIDFVLPILRQLGLGPFLLLQHGPKEKPETALPKPLRDIAGATIFLANQQGMLPLFPPDVAGWNWGKAWITTASMSYRIQMGDILMGIGTNDHGGATALGARLIRSGIPKSAEDIVDRFLENFDAEIPPANRILLIEACTKHGAVAALSKPESAAVMFASMNKLLFASPEFQVA